MRELTPGERCVFEAFAQAKVSSEQEFLAQLEALYVVSMDEGYLNVKPLDTTPPLRSSRGFPIHAWYFDLDGALVSLLLHATFPDGRLHSLERYRPDGEPIANFFPVSSDVIVAPEPPSLHR